MKNTFFLLSLSAAALAVPSGNAVGAVSASAASYVWACTNLGDGGGVLTNGSVAVVGQALAGRMVNSNFTIEVGVVPCMFSAAGDVPPDGSGLVIWMSFKGSTTVPGIGAVADEDIVAYDINAATWSLVFDGSDVGLASSTIDGMAREADGDILLSFTSTAAIGRYLVDDSDIVRFAPTSLGATTAGSFSFLLDASDVGLSTESEDVDAIDIAADGRLIVSTNASFAANGASGDGEDLIVFDATSYGTSTFGSFSEYFDGSDVGLTVVDENVDAAAHTLGGTILLSTDGVLLALGLSAEDEDVVQFAPSTLGTVTAGSYSLLLNLTSHGISGTADVGSLEVFRQ